MFLMMHRFFTHGMEYNEDSCTETPIINSIPALFFLPALILSLIKSKSWRWLIISNLT